MSFRSVAVALLAPALALALGSPAPAAPRSAAPTAAEDPAAVRALDRAQATLAGRGPDRNATMALRDLALQRQQLTGADRASADALLSRPSAQQRKCTKNICVHWTPSNVSSADDNNNGISDYIDQVVTNVNAVHVKYKRAGYRSPESDKGRGGNNKTDVYIKNVGAQGIYGYCTSDQRFYDSANDHSIWAFCVLDNDYSPAEFPTNTPIENMQVTAAHEYFHAVQFAYDVTEDPWFMEATATWVEDEVYDDVDDNVNYLGSSPLTLPEVSLNTFDNSGTFQYGCWIFFRRLTEVYPQSEAGLPTLVRTMWRKADSRKGAPDLADLGAVNAALKGEGSTLKAQFLRFADANLRAQTTYVEGAANSYPETDPWGLATLTPGAPSTGNDSTALDHLTSATARFTPSGLTGAWTLEVVLDLAPKDRGSAAIVTVNLIGDTYDTSVVSLNSAGNATFSVPFSSDTVESVDVTMANTSTKNKDDNRNAVISGTALAP